MFCPSCGSTNSIDQRFCRKCGLNLESAARSLTEQIPAGDRAELARREERIEKFGRLAFIGFLNVLVIAILGLLYAILDRLVFSGNNPIVGILLMAFIVFAMLVLGYVYFRESLKETRKKIVPVESKPDFAHTATTTRLLDEKQFQPIPSVIEDTTELLPSRKRERL
jgi:hypothetical protein